MTYLKIYQTIRVGFGVDKTANLAFYLFNIAFYLFFRPNSYRYTATLSSLYVKDGWTVVVMYFVCVVAPSLSIQRKIDNLQYLAILLFALIFVFRTGRSNFNMRPAKNESLHVFEDEDDAVEAHPLQDLTENAPVDNQKRYHYKTLPEYEHEEQPILNVLHVVCHCTCGHRHIKQICPW